MSETAGIMYAGLSECGRTLDGEPVYVSTHEYEKLPKAEKESLRQLYASKYSLIYSRREGTSPGLRTPCSESAEENPSVQ